MENLPTKTLELLDATPEEARTLGNLINAALAWRTADLEHKILAEVDLAVAVDEFAEEVNRHMPGRN